MQSVSRLVDVSVLVKQNIEIRFSVVQRTPDRKLSIDGLYTTLLGQCETCCTCFLVWLTMYTSGVHTSMSDVKEPSN